MSDRTSHPTRSIALLPLKPNRKVYRHYPIRIFVGCVFALNCNNVENKDFVMKKVNVTQVQDSFDNFLNCIDQEQIVIEKEGKAIATLINYEEWKRLKQLEMELMDEDEENFYTVEEVIAEYNQIHGTEFTVENLKND